MTRRTIGIAAGVVIGAWLLLVVVLPRLATEHTGSGQWESPGPVLLLGAIIGMTYGLLAVGLVLIYRTNRIINFAHGQIGAFGSSIFGLLVARWGVPYWLAFLPALAVAAGVGAGAEALVVRRLRNAPAIMSVVATLGVGQFLVLFAFAINNQAAAGAVYPQPSGLPTFSFGALRVTPAYSAMLLLTPVVVVALTVFLKKSWTGIGIRASAADSEGARTAGIPAARMSALAWGLAGSMAAFSAILTQPSQGFIAAESFGPALLLIALTGAVLARMQSLPRALAAGVGIGIVEQLLLWNYAQAGLVQAVLFVIILVALLVQRQRVGRSEEKGSWAAVQPARPLPRAVRELPAIRFTRVAVGLVALAVFVALPPLISNASAVKLTAAFAFVVVGISVGVVTGLCGQLSLGQFALAAIGAVASYEVFSRTSNIWLSFAYAGVAAAVVSIVIGLPALRVKGLLLTVTTLSFALVLPAYVMQQPWALGTGKDPGRPVIAGTSLDTGRSYYYLALATLLAAMWFASNIRRGGLGRRFVAVRDNEDAARAFTVPASLVKLQGFALAGFIAGIGGAMYGHSLALINSEAFPIQASIDAVVISVLGGIGLLTGPILGAVVVRGATFLPLDTAGLAATAFGQLLIIMYLPRGLASVVVPLRDRVAGWIARRSGVDIAVAEAAERGFDEATEGAGETPRQLPVTPPSARRLAARGPLLDARGLRKSFGGINAVRGIDLVVARGETLGLIGPNGAGKTTTFELLAGFVRPDAGSVRFAGADVTAFTPEARGQLGLIRSFQDAALFPTLTVQECVQLAFERAEPTRLVPALLGLSAQDRKKTLRAAELVDAMGLSRYRSSQIRELSTGTRRIAEIACLVALEPQMLLLDEPSSGVAQRETEALGALLVRLTAELGLTLVIIEHDIPLIMGLADRIVCMADGEVIASGPPSVVREDPAVVTAYLGGSTTAIERSGASRS